ncbi:hypothetical protein CAPTEDRAFT_107521 [Capitella teleta]|uniref:RH1 domain-containing protein n=1 Tax=Capitella teleta TaxID=283909 RepID=X1YTY2_CAPTE|nr:hypothetical protein CAPTEDRAFT_107521 [Capitella teleta]|eukprot:ELT88429.1 hypothetical protein CAPTEDRAFT_107521 [Capitella teleta]
MASETDTLSPVDVYDIAATIGKEFEKIIDNYGPEAVTELMPKIITVLEHLEILSNNNQKENAEISELRFSIERLQADKKAKHEERMKYEKELEQIEETWRNESQQLAARVTQLHDENRRLRAAMQEKEGENEKFQRQSQILVLVPLLRFSLQKNFEKDANDLRIKCHEYRDRVRVLQRDLGQKNMDVEAMQLQLERLARLNADYRRKTTLNQRQAETLIQEKSDLQAQLHDKEQHITRIKDRLNTHDMSASVEGSLLTTPRTSGKMLIDMKDPDRPRFTLHELREVLQERNELKTKLIEVEEELHFYKPEAEIDDFDRPVQGPINKEPDEKLFPDRYKESGIRKL